MADFLRRLRERAAEFLFNLRNAFYEQNGEQVTDETLLGLLAGRIDDVSAAAQTLIDALTTGDLSLGDWAEAFAIELRRAHSQIYALGRGGWAQMSAADRAAVAARLRDEFAYLRQFAQDIADGKLSAAQIKARMDLYANHLRVSYYEGLRAAKAEAGYMKERRVMGVAEHCADCEGFASEGWQEIGHFPPPGDGSVCMANCQCDMEFQ